MANFVVVQGIAWGNKSYPLAKFNSGGEREQIQASNLPAAVSKAARMLGSRVPKGKKLDRMDLELMRIYGGISHHTNRKSPLYASRRDKDHARLSEI